MTVDSEVLTPLFRFGTVPYAAYATKAGEADHATEAGNAATLGSEKPSAFARVDDTIPALSCASANRVVMWDGSNWICGLISSSATYTDADARVAMGVVSIDNSLNHARYVDAEARGAMGAKANGNALNHDRYSDAEARSAMGTKANSNALNHDRYGDADARAACYDTKAELTTALSGDYAAASHNHDGRYALINHNHDTAYAPISHDHDASYVQTQPGTVFLSGDLSSDMPVSAIFAYAACMNISKEFRTLSTRTGKDCSATCGTCLGALIPSGTGFTSSDVWGDRHCDNQNAAWCCCK